MKIYKHMFDGFCIHTVEIDVVKETPKTYKTKWGVILKSDVGVLRRCFSMYSLSREPLALLKVLIEREKSNIDHYKGMIAKSEDKVLKLRKLIAEAESEEQQCKE